jgi:YD repeat-containing protein
VIPTESSCPRCGGPLTARLCTNCGPIAAPWQYSLERKTRVRKTADILSIALFVAIIAFTALVYRRQNAPIPATTYPVHDGPVASLDQLKGAGRIYLEQMGPHLMPYSVDDAAAWLRAKYHLDVKVLPPTELDRAAWKGSRRQYIAEMLYDQLKREHPDLAADPNAYLIGFTDADMFSVWHDWKFSDTQRDMERAAVISAAHLGSIGQASSQRLQQRLRRFLLKDVAVLYWQLPLNDDPSSLLQRYLPPDVPAEDIFESDLLPSREKWGEAEGEACIFLRYSPKDGLEPLPGKLIRSCADEDTPKAGELEETFELSLRYGTLLDRHVDFLLPGGAPIEFERMTRAGWTGALGFGISGTHNYDKYLRSPDDMATIQLIYPEGSWQLLKRVPKWLPMLSLVKYVDADFSGSAYEIRWHNTPFENFLRTRYDGATETYLPCDGKTLCYENGYHGPDGQEIVFQRDPQRRLTKLTSSGGQWLSLMYGLENHISEITDNRGRNVKYGYDTRNRLLTVTYPSGEIHRYTYDDDQHLLTFRVANDPSSTPRLLLRNYYSQDRLVKQELAGGRVFRYQYNLSTSSGRVVSALAGEGDAPKFTVRFNGEESTIWQLPDSNPGRTPELSSRAVAPTSSR